MKRTHGILRRLVLLCTSHRARWGAALLALALLAPACGGGGGGGFFIAHTVQFEQSSFTVAENGGTATITVTRIGSSAGAVSVNFTTSNGTAGQPGDYATNSGTIAWADGDATPKTFTVTIANDGTVEGDETVNLTLSLPTGGASLGAFPTAVLTITDDDAPAAGVLQFSTAAYSVNEGLATATITVTRTGGTTGAASVNFADGGGGSATAGGTDYTLVGGTLNWTAGDGTPKTFTVAINNDALPEGSETVNLVLNTFVGAVQGTTNAAVLTIIDNDSNGVIQLSSATYNVTESGVTATITATRTGGSQGAVGATFATSNGTATEPGDYTATTGTVSWADGDTANKTFDVTILNDTAIEGNETVNLTLTLPTGGATLGAQATAVLTVLDDDCTLEFTAATFNIVEGIGTATVTVSRTGSTLGAVSVDFTNPAGGTATAGGTDYTFVAGTLNWAIGDGANKTISMPFNADALSEGNETINLLLSNAAGVGVLMGAQASATATVVDDDVTFVFSAANYSVGENGATATITVNRVGASVGAASVNFATSDGTATTADGDYAANAGTLNWATGITTPQTFNVTITNNATVEPDEMVNLALTVPTLAGGDSVTVGTPGTAVLTITNDDVNLQLTSATYAGAENGGAITITVTRTGLTTGAASVTWSLVNGTTVNGDYTATPGTLNWPAGDGANKTFTITPVNDALIEGSETLTINLTGPTGVGVSLGTPNSAVLTITDDDVPSASIDDVAVSEGAAGTVNFTFTISLSAAPAVGGSVTVNTANGTATAPGDYTAIVSQVVNFPAGPGTTQQVTVTVNGDGTDEVNETFFVNLSTPVNLNISDNQGLGTILNDDDPNVTVADVSQVEGTGGTTTFAFVVTLSQVSLQDVTFNYSTANGTATSASGDYTAIPTTNRTIPAGQLTTTINVTVGPDAVDEANETFVLDLFTFTNTNFVDNQATGTIQNDDNPTITINDVTQAEGAGNMTFTVTLSNASAEIVSVNFATADGIGPTGALSASDYTAQSNTLNIPIGQLTGQIIIAINSDGLDEVNEHFFVNLTTPVNATITDSQGQGNITDDDGPNITISDVALPEGNGATTTFAFTVTLSGISAQDVSVNYSTSNGSAIAPGDYTAIPSTLLTIPAGQLTGTINVLVNGDTTGEPDEGFSVNLSGAVNGTITDNQGVGTIQNEDAPSLTINNVSVAETNGGTTTATFTVTASNTWIAPIDVTYSTQDGTATTANSDYVQVVAAIATIPMGLLTANITITINGDTTLEPNETFFVNLTGATAGTIADNQGQGTITNDDGPNITVDQNTALVEGTGPGTTTTPFTVSLSGPPTSTVTVDYTTVDGTATVADGDYTPRNGTLTFTVGGPTVQVIDVTITRDNKRESNETFSVTISNANGGTITVPTDTATIFDDDPQPQISISDVTLAEGNAGTTAFTFNVTLSHASFETITVTANTVDGTATLANSDYQQVLNQTVTFNPFDTSETVTVLVNGDTNLEPGESFTVALTAPSNATVLDGSGLGTITNDEGPTVTFSPTNGSTDVNVDSNFVLTFSMLMNKASVVPTINGGAISFLAIWDTPAGNPNGTVLTLIPDTVAPIGTITYLDRLADNAVITCNLAAGAQDSALAFTMGAQASNFTTRLDSTPPVVSTITPNPAAAVLNNVTTFQVVFNEAMNTSNGGLQVQVEGPNDQRSASAGTVAGSLTVVWANTTTVNIGFSPALTANSAYRLELRNAQDANTVSNNNNLRYTVITQGSKVNPPTVTANWPPPGAVGVSRDSGIFIAFSEPVSPDIVTRIQVTGAATPVRVRYEPGDGDNGVEITPRQGWPASTTITVTIPGGAGGVTNPSLVPFAANFVSSFTTGATGVGTNPVVIDAPFSTLKDAMTDCSTFGAAAGELVFKDSITNARVFMNDLTMDHTAVSITDPNGIPIKNYGINPFSDSDVGQSLQMGSSGGFGLTQLQFNTTYTVTFKSSIAGSCGQTFAQTVYTFTTIANATTMERPSTNLNDVRAQTAPGPVRGVDLRLNFSSGFNSSIASVVDAGANTVYNVSNGVPPWVVASSSVRVSGCSNASNNGVFTVVSVVPGSPTVLTLANAAGVNEASPPFNASVGPPVSAAVADVTGGGNTFTANLTKIDFDWEYSSSGNEPGFVTAGTHTLRFTISDTVPAHQSTVDSRVFFFTQAEMTQQTLNAPSAGLTPTYSWTGAAPASATALFLIVFDSVGDELGFWILPPTATSFATPPNYPLTAGQNYSWTLGYFNSPDNTLRGEGGEGLKTAVNFSR